MLRHWHSGCLLLLCSAGLVMAQQSGQTGEDAASPENAQQLQNQQREEARRWLERMALAMEHLNYRGTFVYSHSGRLQSLSVVHMRDASGVRERLYSLDGDNREVRRNNNLVHAVAPEQDHYSLMNYRQFTRLPSSSLLRTKSRYRFELGDKQRIASQLAQQIRIEPTDSFRYGYELWLEERTGMLLKQVMLNERGRVLEKLVFTNIELGAQIDAQDLPDAGSVLQPELLADVNSQPRWRPSQVPSGFELLAHQQRQKTPPAEAQAESPVTEQAHEQKNDLEHLLYSDGLAHVSVYLEPQDVASVDTEYPASRYGVVNIYSRSMDGMYITALGAVPYRTLRMIGGSIYDSERLQPAGQQQNNANAPGQ